MTTFLHTADWQLGKPFARVDDVNKRSLLQQERIVAIERIGAAIAAHKAAFVLVAGDLFDSPSATRATVSAACSKIGALRVPVLVIPGNHDHGGPGSLWEQPFFLREQEQLAPNLRILLRPEPVELDDVVLFPCPLLRRQESADPTQWLRSPEIAERFPGKTRVVLAHGSTQGFGSTGDEDSDADSAAAILDLNRLPADHYDYIALGDWHGTKQVGPCAWYSGTPEPDRFPKGGDHDQGNILAVTVGRGAAPQVERVRTGRFAWHVRDFTFADDADVAQLAAQLHELLATRTGEDLLRLTLQGSLGLAATDQLEQLLESQQARLLRLKLTDHTVMAPSEEEIAALTQRATDPLIAHVAATLVARAAGTDDAALVARVALRELHAAAHAN